MFPAFPFLIALIVLVSILSVPLLIYLVGLLLPSKHTIHRTVTLAIAPERLWSILTCIEQYPTWQSRVEHVVIDRDRSSETCTKFVEHSHHMRSTRVTLVELDHLKVLQRILEECPTTDSTRSCKPTFTGTWTFDLAHANDDRQNVTLTITEKGEITKPMLRVTHMFLSGFHHRVDRFVKDLIKKVEQEKTAPERTSSATDMDASFAIEKEWDFMNETYDHIKSE